MKNIISTLFFCLIWWQNGGAQHRNVTLQSKIDYTNETLANVWGWWSDGREYALVGAAKGLSIVDITVPSAPVKIVQIPGPNNLWKEIKTFRNFAYIVSEGGMGVQIVDLSGLPSANLPYKSYRGDGAIANQLNKAHALHIDEKKGFLYAYGSNLAGGGPVVLDLNADPWNPQFVGWLPDLGYVHDGFADNDTLFSAHIYAGMFAVVDMSNKSQPKILATQNTPGLFTHNTWLTNDRKTLLTTDEVNNSVLAAYDISNPDNIQLLDAIKSNPGSNSMVHNTHIINDFAVTSWYKDGFTIVDIADPANLVQVGNYDTYGGSGGGSDGCWGVYPFFPSGTTIASNIRGLGSNNGELLILTPNYVRAGRLQGTVSAAADGLPLAGVQVEVLQHTPTLSKTTPVSGKYKVGTVENQRLTVRFSKSGYQTFEQEVFFQPGQIVTLDVELFPQKNILVEGTVVSGKSGQPIAHASVQFFNKNGQSIEIQADAAGKFLITDLLAGMYDIAAQSSWGTSSMLHGQKLLENQQVELRIAPERIGRFSIKN